MPRRRPAAPAGLALGASTGTSGTAADLGWAPPRARPGTPTASTSTSRRRPPGRRRARSSGGPGGGSRAPGRTRGRRPRGAPRGPRVQRRPARSRGRRDGDGRGTARGRRCASRDPCGRAPSHARPGGRPGPRRSRARNNRAVGRSKTRSNSRSRSARTAIAGATATRAVGIGPGTVPRPARTNVPSVAVPRSPDSLEHRPILLALARTGSGHARPSHGELMTEILTESFCERCGTRYTFEIGRTAQSRVGRVRTVSRGLRNFVLSDETTPVRGDGGRAQRRGAQRDDEPARRVPPDVQLLPDLSPVHVRQLLEHGRGPVPHLHAAAGHGGGRRAAGRPADRLRRRTPTGSTPTNRSRRSSAPRRGRRRMSASTGSAG